MTLTRSTPVAVVTLMMTEGLAVAGVAAAAGNRGGEVVDVGADAGRVVVLFARATDAAVVSLALAHLPSGTAPALGPPKVALHSAEAVAADGTISLAALDRLEVLLGLARPQAVVVSQSAAQIVVDHLRGATLVAVEHDGPAAFELVPEQASPPGPAGTTEFEFPIPRPLLGRGFFVGRTREIDLLSEAWTTTAAGQPRVALLAGEAGIGKTHLACEIARHAHEHGGIVLFGRCDEELGVSYEPFAEALSRFVATCPPPQITRWIGDHAGELLRLAPEIATRAGPVTWPSRSDPETEQYRLFDAVSSWLSGLSDQRPVLFVLDDLHWADSTTLMLLRHIVRHAEHARLLIVGTYRATDMDPTSPLATTIADLHRLGRPIRLVIDGLDEAAATAFVTAAREEGVDDDAGRDGDAQELARVLMAHTEGNPFFMHEMLQLYFEHRDFGVPEGVREVLGWRLSRLAPDTNRLLTMASVVGTEISLRLLDHIHQREHQADDPNASAVAGNQLVDALDEAVDRGILLERGDRYSFSHALIRQTIYEGLGPTRRVRLHCRVGEAIEELPDAGEFVEALAHHFGVCATDGNAAKAARYALAAGQRCLERLSYDEAISFFERGRAAGGNDVDGAVRSELLLALARAHHATGAVEAARAAAMEGAGIARTIGRYDRIADAAVFLTRQTTGAVPDADAIALSHEALANLPADGARASRARVIAGLAKYAAFAEQRRLRAQGLASEAIELARAADPKALAEVLATVIYAAYLGSPEPATARGLADELVALAQEQGDDLSLAEGYVARSAAAMALADREQFDADLAALQVIAGRQRARYLRAVATSLSTAQALLDGRFADAQRQIDELLAGNEDPTVVNWVHAQQLFLSAERGQARTMQPQLDQAIADRPTVAGFRAAALSLEATRGDTEHAQQGINDLVAGDFGGVDRDGMWPVALSIMSAAVARLRDEGQARGVYEHLTPYAGTIVVVGRTNCYGAADRYLGTMATTFGEYRLAESHFESAIALETQLKAPPLVARSQHAYSRMLIARDESGDQQRARTLLSAALATAESLGMATLTASTRARLG